MSGLKFNGKNPKEKTDKERITELEEKIAKLEKIIEENTTN
jgi:uncharacterized coiled-coil protein SlyX